ncbi:MAG: Coq4 family protein [Pseudobdellovibrionaceae bacterium]
MQILWKIRLVWALIRISSNPNNTPAVFAIGEAFYHLGATEAAREKLSSQPDSLEVIKSRKMLKPVNLQELQKLPPGTLGRVYADHMIGNNLDPNFYKTFEVTNDSIMAIMRLRQTHDLWHVVTGFSTTVEDELGLQSFMYAQTAAPLSPLLIAGGLLRASFKNRRMSAPILDCVATGWMMGKNARPLFAVDWEANWLTPLADLRREYGIEPVTR